MHQLLDEDVRDAVPLCSIPHEILDPNPRPALDTHTERRRLACNGFAPPPPPKLFCTVYTSLFTQAAGTGASVGKKLSEPSHRGCPTQKTCPMQRTGAGTVFGFHTVFWLSHGTLMLLMHSTPDWCHPGTIITREFVYHRHIQDGDRAGAKCEARAVPMAVLKSLPSPALFEPFLRRGSLAEFGLCLPQSLWYAAGATTTLSHNLDMRILVP